MTIRHLTRDGQEPGGPLFAGLAASLEGDSDRRAPLILLHGLTFDRTMWRPAVAELRKLDPGRQIFAIDLPGHGRPPAWPSYQFQGIADAVHRAALEANLRTPVLVGHSAGAVIATRLAALRTAQMPYLFIAGNKVGPDYLNWLNHVLPQASVTEWPASGHFPHLAHPRRFAECLAATARWGELANQP